ncbi:MAG: hypothetical protein LAP85_24730 [Acidobacteriia bacterium]|nr:hypothetical protein [Terriglobia bacterium]
MSMILRAVIFYLLLGSVQAVPRPEAQEPVPGKIVEKVNCRRDPGQSYALYLPSGYTADRKWPILYALDPGARGLLPVQRFQNAAEKYGYIVAGSNNSRNGPIRIVQDAMDALLADTDARFALDSKRIYLAGFSGGARVAVMIGFALKGRVAGVIGCGAGFPPSIAPSTSIPFSWSGSTGIEDFNFPELKELDQTLGRLAIPHELEIFPGGHDWPPATVCTRALEWMELQGMKSGIRARDDAIMGEIFSRRLAEAQALESGRQVYQAFLRYDALAKDFAGLRDTNEFQMKSAHLAQSAEVRRALALERDSVDRQRRTDFIEIARGGPRSGL